MTSTVRPSSGNVFRDLGFPPVEAENLRIRSELMTRLERLIGRKGWTQTEAARQLGVSRVRVSDLARGRIERFSIDTLVSMLTKVGVRVSLAAHPARAGQVPSGSPRPA